MRDYDAVKNGASKVIKQPDAGLQPVTQPVETQRIDPSLGKDYGPSHYINDEFSLNVTPNTIMRGLRLTRRTRWRRLRDIKARRSAHILPRRTR